MQVELFVVSDPLSRPKLYNNLQTFPDEKYLQRQEALFITSLPSPLSGDSQM